MALLGPLKAHPGPCAAGPLAWALVSCTLTPTLWPRPTPVWGYLGLPLSPGRLSLRLVQLFQPGLCVRGWAAQGPDKCIHSRHLCQLSAASAQCLPLAVPMWPVFSPTAAAGGGGWHHRQTRHPARAGGFQAPSPHPALSTRNVSSASSCHIHPTCQLSAPLSALHLHLSSTELLASLLGRSDHA